MAVKRSKKGQFLPGNMESKGPIGNQHAKKLKSPDLRKEAYKQYCDHLASGMPKETFTFRHPELSLTSKTMEKYIRENPAEFPIINKELAECERYKVWINDGLAMMKGTIEKCQPAIYQMFMRNMFGWDKEDLTKKETSEPLVKKIAAMWRGEKDV